MKTTSIVVEKLKHKLKDNFEFSRRFFLLGQTI